MPSSLRAAFENVRITPQTRTDRRSLAVRIVERMKAQDARIRSARTYRNAPIDALREALGEKGNG